MKREDKGRQEVREKEKRFKKKVRHNDNEWLSIEQFSIHCRKTKTKQITFQLNYSTKILT